MENKDVEAIFKTLRDNMIVQNDNQNSLSLNDNFISLYDLIRLTKENYMDSCKKADAYKRKMMAILDYSIKISIDPGRKDQFSMVMFTSCGSYRKNKMQVVDDDLLFVEKDVPINSNVMQKIGDMLLSYYKDILINDDIIKSYNISSDTVSVSCEVDYNYQYQSQIDIKIFGSYQSTLPISSRECCCISIKFNDQQNKFSVDCDSLKVVNFIKENQDAVLKNMYVSKDKCPKVIVDMLEKEQAQKTKALEQFGYGDKEEEKSLKGFVKSLLKKLNVNGRKDV